MNHDNCCNTSPVWRTFNDKHRRSESIKNPSRSTPMTGFYCKHTLLRNEVSGEAISLAGALQDPRHGSDSTYHVGEPFASHPIVYLVSAFKIPGHGSVKGVKDVLATGSYDYCRGELRLKKVASKPRTAPNYRQSHYPLWSLRNRLVRNGYQFSSSNRCWRVHNSSFCNREPIGLWPGTRVAAPL
ncbi:hypothetical protein FHL15_001874 [Xylaria flabelliformis]|uniref:Uncharacterized protein n=1 Tax=Xylaria flabelliformis TaxID=2512241 RepID=A0A553IA57_9PEZI|nr:hypothetical protein FHL15_001874 [Xylaria flabelliformis]